MTRPNQVNGRRFSTVVCTMGCAWLLAACTVFPSPVASAPPEPTGAPRVVVDRSPLPPCGSETTTQTDGFNVAGRRCFWDAYLNRRAAEFVSTRPTVEGDPITLIFRLLGDGRIEVFEDQTHDRFSWGGWLRLDCPGLSINEPSLEQPDFLPGLPGPTGECVETPIS